jgi:hypothetical protein
VWPDLDPQFFPKVFYFHDRHNSQPLVVEPVLFINLNICGRFWDKGGKFGRKWLEKNNTVDNSGVMRQ